MSLLAEYRNKSFAHSALDHGTQRPSTQCVAFQTCPGQENRGRVASKFRGTPTLHRYQSTLLFLLHHFVNVRDVFASAEVEHACLFRAQHVSFVKTCECEQTEVGSCGARCAMFRDAVLSYMTLNLNNVFYN